MRRDAVTMVRTMGVTDYETTWRAMQSFTQARDAMTPDELWITEHPAVYTVGVAGRSQHLPRFDNGIPVVRTDRGGQITYHGPGQAVIYTLLDLRRHGLTVRALVRLLEQGVVEYLDGEGIRARGDAERPGVYVGEEKIAALGLRVRNGCCYHGLSFNVEPDLTAFEAIDPCGYPGLAVTSARKLGIMAPFPTIAEALADRLCRRLDS